MRKIRKDCKAMLDHVRKTDAHRHPGDARYVDLPSDVCDYRWTEETVLVPSLPEVSPASRRDVQRYAKALKQGHEAPAIVVTVRAGALVVQDGAHRIAAAREARVPRMRAWIGRKSGA